MIIGPMPVIVHDSPVAMRRFSLKYVLSANEFADVLMPEPMPSMEIKSKESWLARKFVGMANTKSDRDLRSRTSCFYQCSA